MYYKLNMARLRRCLQLQPQAPATDCRTAFHAVARRGDGRITSMNI